MEPKPHAYHYLFAASVVFSSAIIFIAYGWGFFATVTERPGLNGDMYFYYQLSRTQYSAYNFLVAITALFISGQLLYFLFKPDRGKLKKTFLRFLLFLGVVIMAECLLNVRFVGKG